MKIDLKKSIFPLAIALHLVLRMFLSNDYLGNEEVLNFEIQNQEINKIEILHDFDVSKEIRKTHEALFTKL